MSHFCNTVEPRLETTSVTRPSHLTRPLDLVPNNLFSVNLLITAARIFGRYSKNLYTAARIFGRQYIMLFTLIGMLCHGLIIVLWCRAIVCYMLVGHLVYRWQHLKSFGANRAGDDRRCVYCHVLT